MKSRIITWKNDHRDIEIEVTKVKRYYRSFFQMLIGVKPKPARYNKLIYVGSSTVWHRKDTGGRCSTSMEMALSEAVKYHKYNDEA